MSGIVVGVDGSEQSIAALRFAAREATLRGTTLRAVYAAEGPTEPWPSLPRSVAVAATGARAVLDLAVEQAFGVAPADAPCEREIVPKLPAEALIEAGDAADLLVVGSRGRGGFAGLLLGSVSLQVAHHAPCPVAIVRAAPTGEPGAVVVAVDGSKESRTALRWADEEARLRATPLIAIHAWTPLFEVGPGLAPTPLPTQVSKADVDEILREVVVDVLGEERAGGVERRVVGTPPALGIVEAAGPSDLLVVGCRGRGGFAGLLLGSVSTQVAHHAPCPLVIVRGDARVGR